ncbi:MAG: hypothetical protein CSA21_02355 [Deltaproteobacteria bacterium]|nr:MAG: hypothetical protein CSA21_02355 [Deltaproteobacteria bacterium]
MAAVSNIQPIAAQEERPPVSRDKGRAASLFARASNLAQADMLLKGTGQYAKWQSIRQKNGVSSVMAENIAADIVNRHAMLEQAKQDANGVDWNKFDALTESIARHGILLLTSEQLAGINKTRSVGSSQPSIHSPVFKPLMTKDFTARMQPLQPDEQNKSPLAARSERSTTIQESGNLSGEAASSQGPAEEMVVDVVCGQHRLTPAMLALGNEKKIMLPLGELSRILEFTIAADPQTGKAAGWFLSENRTFSLDAVSGTGSIEGKPISVASEHMMRTKDEIYVDANTLSTWFPVDLHFDFTRQSIAVHPREELPFQTRDARHLSWKKSLTSGNNAPQFPRTTSEYELIETPVVDMGGAGAYRKTANNSDSSQSSYYLHATGDLALMNSELYLSGDNNNQLETARLTLKREDPDGKMLGTAHATKAAVGDIRVPDFPIVGGGKYERGVTISNKSLHRSSEYDSTFFEGSLAPGWDVEVYRNNVLLDHQQVGADGRYVFEDVALYYGANNFTLKFYGPRGEVRQEEKQIMVGGEMMKPGELQYELSVSQKDENLLGVDEPKYSNGKGSGRFLARYEYGLTPQLSLQGGVVSQHAGTKRHTYLHAGARGSVAQSYLTGDLVFDPNNGGYAAQVLGQKKVGPLDVRLRHQLFQDFSTTGSTNDSNALQSRTTLSAFGRIQNGLFPGDIPFSLNVTNSKRKSGSENSANAHISTRIKNTSLNTSINWYDREQNAQEADLTGSSSLTSEFKDLRLRGSVDYDLHPERTLTSARVSAVKQLTEDLNAELAVSREMDREDNDLTSVSLSANVNNGKWSLSPSIGYNSDDEVRAALMFNVSLGSEPRTGKTVLSSDRHADQGAVSARVFHDKNNNKVFDDGDEPIENARVAAVQSFRDAVTDEDGIAFVRGLPKNQATDVTLDTTTLEDPYWEPSLPGQSVVPRSGHVEMIDIPVTTTGEIDGALSLRRVDGTVRELSHAPLQLIDENDQVVSATRSEYDGFYLFEKVIPGEYRVRLEPEFEKTLHLQETAPVSVTISSEGNVVSGMDIALVEQSSDVLGNSVIVQKKSTQGHSGDLAEAARPAHAIRLRGDTPSPAPPEKAGDASVLEAKTEPSVFVASSDAVRPVASHSGNQQYGCHLSSYRTMEKAVQGISYQVSKHRNILSESDFSVQKTDLGPKGTWYRVVAGNFSREEQAQELSRKIKQRDIFSQPVAIEKTGQLTVHAASYQSLERAVKGVDILAKQGAANHISIRKVDLGAKGVWYRILLGRFDEQDQANTLVAKLQNAGKYAKVMPL